MTHRPIRKAVMPVAGLGTRILPATKIVPKEMMNVVDQPVLAYVVAEALASGIEHIVFVTGRGKGAIEDYFDHQFEMEALLEARGKTVALNGLRQALPKPGQMSFVRQMAPKGLGHAVWCARDIIGDEPFAVLLPDMILDAPRPALRQAIDQYEASGDNIIVVEAVPEDQTHQFGVVALEPGEGRARRMTGMVEKPPQGTAPSNLIISGRYVLNSEIFAVLEDQAAGAGGEIQLTDAMARLMKAQAFYAFEYEGVTYDCGDKLGLLRANLALALNRADLGTATREMINKML